MIVVTSGGRYIDIDAYACCVAYAELYKLLGKEAVAVSRATWNESITKSLRDLGATLATHYSPMANDTYAIMDVSDPSHFDSIVDEARVVEIIDHHPGFEEYWAQRLDEKARIEFIGAAATLVYERWQAMGKLHNMSRSSAELLAAAILDNTLNFQAGVTTERDQVAYRFLAEYASLDEAWVSRYFSECQEAILGDLPKALRNDTKFLSFAGLPGELCLGQLVVWDARQVVAHESQRIADILEGMGELWLANVVSISEGRSYFLAQHSTVQQWLQGLFRVTFVDSIATADRLWLRKEIMKAAQRPSPAA